MTKTNFEKIKEMTDDLTEDELIILGHNLCDGLKCGGCPMDEESYTECRRKLAKWAIKQIREVKRI